MLTKENIFLLNELTQKIIINNDDITELYNFFDDNYINNLNNDDSIVIVRILKNNDFKLENIFQLIYLYDILKKYDYKINIASSYYRGMINFIKKNVNDKINISIDFYNDMLEVFYVKNNDNNKPIVYHKYNAKIPLLHEIIAFIRLVIE